MGGDERPFSMPNRACKMPYEKRTIDISRRDGGLSYAPYGTRFEADAKGSEGSLTGVGSRRYVFVAGGRRIRGNRCAGHGYNVAARRPGSGSHAQ